MPEGSENKGCSVGTYLRENRLSRGLSLDDVARITRIGKNYLAALEEDRFDTLPNPAYVKGFLRAYANLLDLSGDEVIARYDRSGTPADPEIPSHKEETRTLDSARHGTSYRGRWTVPLFLLVLVIGAAYLFKDKEAVQEKPSVPSSQPMAAAPLPVLHPLTSAARPADIPPASRDLAKSDTAPASGETPSGGMVLRLKVNQDSSLNVTIDDMVSQQYDLKAGDLIEWKADKAIALDMGNPGGVEAELNGRPLKLSGEPGKPAHVVLRGDTPAP